MSVSPRRSARSWQAGRRLLGHALAIAAAGFLAGLPFGAGALGLFGGVAILLGWHLARLAALRAWVDRPRGLELPEARGVWGEVFAGLLVLQRRSRARSRRLAAMLARFESSANALPDGAVVLGARGEIAWFNVAARALLGLRTPQDVGQRLPNLLRHPEFTAAFDDRRSDVELEVPSPINAGVMLNLRIVPYGEGQRLVIVRDVSERRRLEHVRRDFVANASHELRTPLTVLRGYLEMMSREEHEALAPWRGPLQEMNAQAARMDALVRDLLKLARLEAESAGGAQDVVDVAGIVGSAVAEAQALSRGQHHVQAQVDDALALYGRALEIESVVTNLLTNAVQYTPAGGTISVTWALASGGAEFTVADTGIGVAAEDVPRLTERFYRVDEGRSRATGGTGLGLSIVKHALERLEGALLIDSQLGKGSTFTCRFPLHRVVRRRAPSAVQAPRAVTKPS